MRTRYTRGVSSAGERLLDKQEVSGSIPLRPTRQNRSSEALSGGLATEYGGFLGGGARDMRGKTSEVVYTAAKSSPTELSKCPCRSRVITIEA